jgi:hypothetical protein
MKGASMMAKRKRDERFQKEMPVTSSLGHSKFDGLRDEKGKIGWIEVPGEILLVWKGKPWESRPKKLALLVAFYVFSYLISLLIFPDLGLFLVLIPLLLLGSASSHLVNSYYIITSEGVYWKNFLNQMFKPWIGIEGFIFEEEMGELFFEKGSIRSRIQRNMPIYYDGNHERVESLIKEYHTRAWASIKERILADEERIRSEVMAKLDRQEKGE